MVVASAHQPSCTREDRWDIPEILLVPMESLTAYFARIHEIPTLTAEEETVLGRAIQTGQSDAAIELAFYNLRYAAHLARKWENPQTAETVWSLGDGVQAANIGLWKAAHRYDPDRARFTTLATWWIRQSWTQNRNDFLWHVRLPANAQREWFTYQRTVTAWTTAHRTAPTIDELHRLLGWPIERLVFWQDWAAQGSRSLSLDHPEGDDHEATLANLIPASDEQIWKTLDQHLQQQTVDHLLTYLSPREADVLRLRFGMVGSPMTLAEIGQVFHVSRERIRQIEARALKKLRGTVSRHPEWELRDLLSS